MSREIDELVIFLEELSVKVMLETGLLPKIIPDKVQIRCICFDGKQDLDKNVLGKLRGWQNPKAAFVILRDQDSGDCRKIKQQLLDKCRSADKPFMLIRIASHELESWYLGDLNAVEKGLVLKVLPRARITESFESQIRCQMQARNWRNLLIGSIKK